MMDALQLQLPTQTHLKLAHYGRYRGHVGKTGTQRQSAPAVNKDEMTREDTRPLKVRNEARREEN